MEKIETTPRGVTREDLEAAARIVLRYAAAVEKTLYWGMTTAEARAAIGEARALGARLEEAARGTGGDT